MWISNVTSSLFLPDSYLFTTNPKHTKAFWQQQQQQLSRWVASMIRQQLLDTGRQTRKRSPQISGFAFTVAPRLDPEPNLCTLCPSSSVPFLFPFLFLFSMRLMILLLSSRNLLLLLLLLLFLPREQAPLSFWYDKQTDTPQQSS